MRGLEGKLNLKSDVERLDCRTLRASGTEIER